MSNKRPLFQCVCCGSEQTFPAEELRVHNDDLWCSDCWNGSEMSTDAGIEYSDLPAFVPEADLSINSLTVTNLRLQAMNSELADVLTAMVNYDAEQHGGKSLVDAELLWDRAAAVLAQALEQANDEALMPCPADHFPVPIDAIMNAASDNMNRSNLWRHNTIQAFKGILSAIPLKQRFMRV